MITKDMLVSRTVEVSEESIGEFLRIWKQEFDKPISRGEAKAIIHRVVGLYVHMRRALRARNQQESQ